MAKKSLGWIGIVDGKPFWEKTADDYVSPGGPLVPMLTIYKSKKEARKRFDDVWPVGRM